MRGCVKGILPMRCSGDVRSTARVLAGSIMVASPICPRAAQGGCYGCHQRPGRRPRGAASSGGRNGDELNRERGLGGRVAGIWWVVCVIILRSDGGAGRGRGGAGGGARAKPARHDPRHLGAPPPRSRHSEGLLGAPLYHPSFIHPTHPPPRVIWVSSTAPRRPCPTAPAPCCAGPLSSALAARRPRLPPRVSGSREFRRDAGLGAMHAAPAGPGRTRGTPPVAYLACGGEGAAQRCAARRWRRRARRTAGAEPRAARLHAPAHAHAPACPPHTPRRPATSHPRHAHRPQAPADAPRPAAAAATRAACGRGRRLTATRPGCGRRTSPIRSSSR
jgi:hypothetical protein